VCFVVQVEAKYSTWHKDYSEAQQRMAEVQAYQQKIAEEMQKLKELETEENKRYTLDCILYNTISGRR